MKYEDIPDDFKSELFEAIEQSLWIFKVPFVLHPHSLGAVRYAHEYHPSFTYAAFRNGVSRLFFNWRLIDGPYSVN